MAALSGKSALPSGGTAFILMSSEDAPIPNSFVYRRNEWKCSLAITIVLSLLGLGAPVLGPIVLAPQDDIYKENKDSTDVLSNFRKICYAEFDVLCDYCNKGAQCLLIYEHPLRAILRPYSFQMPRRSPTATAITRPIATHDVCSLEKIMQLIPPDNGRFHSDVVDEEVLEGLVANFVQSLYTKVDKYYGFVGLDDDLRWEGSHNMANITIATLLHLFATPITNDPAEGDYTLASWNGIAPYYTRNQVLDEIEFSMKQHSFRHYHQSLLMNTTAVISNLLSEFRDDISHAGDYLHHYSSSTPIVVNRICEPQQQMSMSHDTIISHHGLVSCLARYHEKDMFFTRKCKTAFEQLPIKLKSLGIDLYSSRSDELPTGFIIFIFYMIAALTLSGTRYSRFEEHCRRKVRHLKQEMEDPVLRRRWERQAIIMVGEGQCEAQLKAWKKNVDNVNVKNIAMRMHRHVIKKLRRGLGRIFAVMSFLFLLDCCVLGVIPFRTGISMLLTPPLTFTITYLAPYWNPKVETKNMEQDDENVDIGIQMTLPLLQAEEKRILQSNSKQDEKGEVT